MEFLVAITLIGLIPAAIASSKGRNFFLWWLYGALIFIVAIIHALVLKPDRKALDRREIEQGMRQCPNCAEMVRQEAKVCRFCQRDLPPLGAPVPS